MDGLVKSANKWVYTYYEVFVNFFVLQKLRRATKPFSKVFHWCIHEYDWLTALSPNAKSGTGILPRLRSSSSYFATTTSSQWAYWHQIKALCEQPNGDLLAYGGISNIPSCCFEDFLFGTRAKVNRFGVRKYVFLSLAGTMLDAIRAQFVCSNARGASKIQAYQR